MDTGIKCFSDIVTMLRELERSELEMVALTYLTDKRQVARLLMVDSLGAAATNDAYHVLRKKVLLAAQPDAELLTRAFFQLISINELHPPRVSLRRVHISTTSSHICANFPPGFT